MRALFDTFLFAAYRSGREANENKYLFSLWSKAQLCCALDWPNALMGIRRLAAPRIDSGPRKIKIQIIKATRHLPGCSLFVNYKPTLFGFNLTPGPIVVETTQDLIY